MAPPASAYRAELLSLEPRMMLSASGPGSALSDNAADVTSWSGQCPCGCSGSPAVHAELASTATAESSQEKFSLSVPVLNSLPGAHAKLVLDFDGDIARSWGSYSVPPTPAYDIDGDPTTFTQTELDNIHQIWARVAEKFSPFNINVTTVDPGYLANREVLRVVIGGDGAWTGGAYGGVAYLGSFYNSSPNIAYAFPKNLANGNPKYTAEVVAHEAGHAFGLQHQSTYNGTQKVDEYNRGDSIRAPLMGVSYFADRGLWWRGTSSVSSTSIQDDMQVLANNNNRFGYRPDDHGDTPSTATPLTVSSGTISASGIIGHMTDRDIFSFVTGGGTVEITAAVAQHGPTLRLRLELLNEDGVQIAAADSNSLGETLHLTGIDAGKYYLVVASHGQYGDVGQYTIAGTVPEAQTPRLLDVEYVFESAPHVLRYRFSDDVSSMISVDSIRLENITDGTVIPSQDLLLQYDSTTNTAEFTFRSPQGVLGSGRYRVTLMENVRDESGAPLQQDSAFHFHFLHGDTNGDGRVDVADLGVMAANWQQQAYGPANGDFNYDGIVDVADLGILAANWQIDLFSEQPVLASGSTGATYDDSVLGATSTTTQKTNGHGRINGKPSAGNPHRLATLVGLDIDGDLLERYDRGIGRLKL